MFKEKNIIGWSSYRDEFPVTKEYIYFDNAAVSPLSTRVRDKVNFVMDQSLKMGILCMDGLFADIAAIRNSAAELIGASADEIAFIKNTTQGVLLAADKAIVTLRGKSIRASLHFYNNINDINKFLAILDR
jgi:selenocysteine lyase/cysteine desulfurase